MAILHWEGTLPANTGLLLAPNHVSVIDPLLIGAAAVHAGRIPRFVGTVGLFRVPVVGAVLRYFDHIPLDRAAISDGTRLDPIRRALLAGECVVMYPEGHITHDPGYFPDVFQTGIVHLAVETATPIVPVAQWGAQHVVGHGRPVFLQWPPHRARVHVRFGTPITLSDPVSTAHPARDTAHALRKHVKQMVRYLAGHNTRSGSSQCS